MENTSDNKAKFFALHLNIKCFKDGFGDYPYPVRPAFLENIADREYLELTPLSQITDEDAIAVANILTMNVSRLFGSISVEKTVANGDVGISIVRDYSHIRSANPKTETVFSFIIKSDFSFMSSNYNGSKLPEVYDYLRSKGYSLPYLGTSVETLIEWGWVRLKQSNG